MCTTKVHLAHDLMLGLVHRQRGLQLAVSSSCSPQHPRLGTTSSCRTTAIHDSFIFDDRVENGTVNRGF